MGRLGAKGSPGEKGDKGSIGEQGSPGNVRMYNSLIDRSVSTDVSSLLDGCYRNTRFERKSRIRWFEGKQR